MTKANDYMTKTDDFDFEAWFLALLIDQPSGAHYNVLIQAKTVLFAFWRLERPKSGASAMEGYNELLKRGRFGLPDPENKIKFRG